MCFRFLFIPMLLLVLGGCSSEEDDRWQCEQVLFKIVSAETIRVKEINWEEGPNKGMSIENGMQLLKGNMDNSFVVGMGAMQSVMRDAMAGQQKKDPEEYLREMVMKEIIYDRRAKLRFNTYDEFGELQKYGLKAICTLRGDRIWAQLVR
ncbi:hypothetical protein [Terasakiella pusilla]|uniref:hypothetical protein n=1 Tax=Terasakiella pusilla TaxID=64973 RepID=UPI003AA8EB6A